MKLKFLLLLIYHSLLAQKLVITDPYLRINASGTDPLYTTYTAAMEKSHLYGDKGYKMNYYEDCLPISYSGDQAGMFFLIWKVDQVVITKIGEYHKKPIVTASFPDMAIIEYEPFQGIQVQETFLV
ncbi:MAG: hypothetical protein JXA68_01180, partial [Ignavibacteriales bacterium]|nr:hypothetical protein [Ignavibacteriales bacterium]